MPSSSGAPGSPPCPDSPRRRPPPPPGQLNRSRSPRRPSGCPCGSPRRLSPPPSASCRSRWDSDTRPASHPADSMPASRPILAAGVPTIPCSSLAPRHRVVHLRHHHVEVPQLVPRDRDRLARDLEVDRHLVWRPRPQRYRHEPVGHLHRFASLTDLQPLVQNWCRARGSRVYVPLLVCLRKIALQYRVSLLFLPSSLVSLLGEAKQQRKKARGGYLRARGQMSGT